MTNHLPNMTKKIGGEGWNDETPCSTYFLLCILGYVPDFRVIILLTKVCTTLLCSKYNVNQVLKQTPTHHD